VFVQSKFGVCAARAGLAFPAVLCVMSLSGAHFQIFFQIVFEEERTSEEQDNISKTKITASQTTVWLHHYFTLLPSSPSIAVGCGDNIVDVVVPYSSVVT
jgi:hypothetical protein